MGRRGGKRTLQRWLYGDVSIQLGRKKTRVERYAFLFPVMVLGTVGLFYLAALILRGLYWSGAIEINFAFDFLENAKLLAALTAIGIFTHYVVHLARRSKTGFLQGRKF
jgi:hypothetical protein